MSTYKPNLFNHYEASIHNEFPLEPYKPLKQDEVFLDDGMLEVAFGDEWLQGNDKEKRVKEQHRVDLALLSQMQEVLKLSKVKANAETLALIRDLKAVCTSPKNWFDKQLVWKAGKDVSYYDKLDAAILTPIIPIISSYAPKLAIRLIDNLPSKVDKRQTESLMHCVIGRAYDESPNAKDGYVAVLKRQQADRPKSFRHNARVHKASWFRRVIRSIPLIGRFVNWLTDGKLNDETQLEAAQRIHQAQQQAKQESTASIASVVSLAPASTLTSELQRKVEEKAVKEVKEVTVATPQPAPQPQLPTPLKKAIQTTGAVSAAMYAKRAEKQELFKKHQAELKPIHEAFAAKQKQWLAAMKYMSDPRVQAVIANSENPPKNAQQYANLVTFAGVVDSIEVTGELEQQFKEWLSAQPAIPKESKELYEQFQQLRDASMNHSRNASLFLSGPLDISDVSLPSRGDDDLAYEQPTLNASRLASFQLYKEAYERQHGVQLPDSFAKYAIAIKVWGALNKGIMKMPADTLASVSGLSGCLEVVSDVAGSHTTAYSSSVSSGQALDPTSMHSHIRSTTTAYPSAKDDSSLHGLSVASPANTQSVATSSRYPASSAAANSSLGGLQPESVNNSQSTVYSNSSGATGSDLQAVLQLSAAVLSVLSDQQTPQSLSAPSTSSATKKPQNDTGVSSMLSADLSMVDPTTPCKASTGQTACEQRTPRALIAIMTGSSVIAASSLGGTPGAGVDAVGLIRALTKGASSVASVGSTSTASKVNSTPTPLQQHDSSINGALATPVTPRTSTPTSLTLSEVSSPLSPIEPLSPQASPLQTPTDERALLGDITSRSKSLQNTPARRNLVSGSRTPDEEASVVSWSAPGTPSFFGDSSQDQSQSPLVVLSPASLFSSPGDKRHSGSLPLAARMGRRVSSESSRFLNERAISSLTAKLVELDKENDASASFLLSATESQQDSTIRKSLHEELQDVGVGPDDFNTSATSYTSDMSIVSNS